MTDYLKALDDFENGIISRFRQTPVLSELDKLSNDKLKKLLLQRRQISLQFTPLYEKALAFVESPRLESGLKWLIKEEFPDGELNHRRAIVEDLQKLGLSKRDIFSSQPTKGTYETIKGLHFVMDSFPIIEQSANADLGALIWLRMTMETLPGEEYDLIVKELVKPKRSFALTEQNSVFYVLHRDHDRKAAPMFEDSNDPKNHSNVIGKCLKELVNSEAKLAYAMNIMNMAESVKAGFYSQFKLRE